MKVTEKGQITIPKPLRDLLGIGAGSEVEFERKGDEPHRAKSERGSHSGTPLGRAPTWSR